MLGWSAQMGVLGVTRSARNQGLMRNALPTVGVLARLHEGIVIVRSTGRRARAAARAME